MTSQAQAAIDWPHTPEGQAASGFNARKSGIHAESHISPGENPGEIEALYRTHLRLSLTSASQIVLVDAPIRRLQAKWVRSMGRKRFRFLRDAASKWVRLVIPPTAAGAL
ncbi:MAG TPA: hypothetical protein VNY05_03540 [Candidatus Acidoferrales bacterium]|jgi:hypothetical protein|nr:hypothetical protein [Candidatus Acidoferrales bacterium]